MVHLVEVPDPLSGDNPRYPLAATEPPEPGRFVVDAALGNPQTADVEGGGNDASSKAQGRP